jgi:hypothetical protein
MRKKRDTSKSSSTYLNSLNALASALSDEPGFWDSKPKTEAAADASLPFPLLASSAANAAASATAADAAVAAAYSCVVWHIKSHR